MRYRIRSPSTTFVVTGTDSPSASTAIGADTCAATPSASSSSTTSPREPGTTRRRYPSGRSSRATSCTRDADGSRTKTAQRTPSGWPRTVRSLEPSPEALDASTEGNVTSSEDSSSNTGRAWLSSGASRNRNRPIRNASPARSGATIGANPRRIRNDPSALLRQRASATRHRRSASFATRSSGVPPTAGGSSGTAKGLFEITAPPGPSLPLFNASAVPERTWSTSATGGTVG